MPKTPPLKKPPVSQVLIEMALAAGQGIGDPTVKFTEAAGAFWNKHYKSTVKLALAVPRSKWSVDRRKVLLVAKSMGREAKRLAGKKKVIDLAEAKKASLKASLDRRCVRGGGKYCP